MVGSFCTLIMKVFVCNFYSKVYLSRFKKIKQRYVKYLIYVLILTLMKF